MKEIFNEKKELYFSLMQYIDDSDKSEDYFQRINNIICQKGKKTMNNLKNFFD